jgi:hypothetical protein
MLARLRQHACRTFLVAGSHGLCMHAHIHHIWTGVRKHRLRPGNKLEYRFSRTEQVRRRRFVMSLVTCYMVVGCLITYVPISSLSPVSLVAGSTLGACMTVSIVRGRWSHSKFLPRAVVAFGLFLLVTELLAR